MIRDEAKNKSGFGKNVSNWIHRSKVYPTNVMHLATECSNVQHSAAFPESLPNWFIRLFTRKGDVVLDPFMGSGTTAIAAMHLDRSFVGIEAEAEYHKYALERIQGASAPRRRVEAKERAKHIISLEQTS